MKIRYAIIAVLCTVIILIGCHLDATYTMKGYVEFVNGNEITFVDETGNLFSCTTETEEMTPNLDKGNEYILKFSHKGTESNRLDDGLIDFGKHSFLWFVW